MGQLHVSLTLPGAVSLGAYEGGALAALLVAVQALDGGVVVDSIGAASAGSITGLLAARSLTAGADPVQVMSEAWVDLDSLKTLKTTNWSRHFPPRRSRGWPPRSYPLQACRGGQPELNKNRSGCPWRWPVWPASTTSS